jgi:hypothetical protein
VTLLLILSSALSQAVCRIVVFWVQWIGQRLVSSPQSLKQWHDWMLVVSFGD